LLVLVLLPVFAPDPAPVRSAASVPRSALTLLKLALFTAVIVVVGPAAVPWILRHVAGTGSRELFTLSVLAIALGVAYVSSQWFGGIDRARRLLRRHAAQRIRAQPQGGGGFAAHARCLRGAVLRFGGHAVRPLHPAAPALPVLACVAVVMLGKPLAAWLVCALLGHNERYASTIAASVSQIGEFSFILAGLAISLRLMPPAGRDLVLAAR
jgi:CPA2 family monovalent cation:H+ antiporter-2